MKSACCKTKENCRRRRATSVPSARCWDSLEYVSDLCCTRLMAWSLMRACTSEPTSPHVDIARGRREKVAGKESRYLFFFRSTASVRCFPTWRAAFPRLEPAQGLTMVMSNRSALFLSRGWLSKSAPASVVMSIRNGFSLTFLKKNLNAPRPSEHPPVRGKKCQNV